MFSETTDQMEARAEWISELAENTGLSLYEAGQIAAEAARPGNLILMRSDEYTMKPEITKAIKAAMGALPEFVLALKGREGEVISVYEELDEALEDLAEVGFPVEMHFYDVARTKQ